ncbi:MAG: DPP IV N-terminal domain-containing protein [Gemmatimonadaceae bacterium]
MKRLGLVGALIVFGACARPTSSVLPRETALSLASALDPAYTYSPDGSRIAYWTRNTDSSSGFTLWAARADMTAPAKLLSSQGTYGQALWSPDGSQLATLSDRFGSADVVVVPATGGPPRRLTTTPGFAAPTAWYPDGDRLAYMATTAGGSASTFAVALKTGASTPLVPDERSPYLGVPSPDGSHIALNVFDDHGGSTIWVADSGGHNPRQLTTEGFESFGGLQNAWSPDGKELLYVSNRTGTTDLWVVPIAGGAPRQLTRDVRNDQDGIWSPDGQWVAFRSNRGRQWNLWVVSAAGGDARRITDDAQNEQSMAWRPHSNVLTFVRPTVTNSVWAMDLASGAERRLTPDSVRTGGFFLSPDGSQLDYVIDRGGGLQELVVMPIGGGASRTVVPAVASISDYMWSPDGTKIGFRSDRGGFTHVWVVDAAGGAPRELESWQSDEISFAWSGDGAEIYFVSGHDSKGADVWKVPVAGGSPQRVTTDGRAQSIAGRPGETDLYLGTLSARAGQAAIERLRPDGHQQVVWDKTNASVTYQAASPSGDSLVAQVEQPGGKLRSMIIAANGGGGRVILGPNEFAGSWSPDGRVITYDVTTSGESDLGIYDIATGTKRRLTNTPENEGGEEVTRDGKTIVFNRARPLFRIYTVDLTKLLAAPGK